jgi:hypothetical protein
MTPTSLTALRWLYGLSMLLMTILSAHINYKWRGEKREWQGPFYEEEWPMEEPEPVSLTKIALQLVLIFTTAIIDHILFIGYPLF